MEDALRSETHCIINSGQVHSWSLEPPLALPTAKVAVFPLTGPCGAFFRRRKIPTGNRKKRVGMPAEEEALR